MEKFWAVILIFVVVAAAGLMYVNQVYNPQKDTQMAMADMANQTLSAVKLEIGDGTISREIRGDQVRATLEGYLAGNTISRISVVGNNFNDVDNIADITDLDTIVQGSSQYYMKIISDEGKISEISIIEI